MKDKIKLRLYNIDLTLFDPFNADAEKWSQQPVGANIINIADSGLVTLKFRIYATAKLYAFKKISANLECCDVDLRQYLIGVTDGADANDAVGLMYLRPDQPYPDSEGS